MPNHRHWLRPRQLVDIPLILSPLNKLEGEQESAPALIVYLHHLPQPSPGVVEEKDKHVFFFLIPMTLLMFGTVGSGWWECVSVGEWLEEQRGDGCRPLTASAAGCEEPTHLCSGENLLLNANHWLNDLKRARCEDVCVWVCVCVRVRDRERETKREPRRERERESLHSCACFYLCFCEQCKTEKGVFILSVIHLGCNTFSISKHNHSLAAVLSDTCALPICDLVTLQLHSYSMQSYFQQKYIIEMCDSVELTSFLSMLHFVYPPF